MKTVAERLCNLSKYLWLVSCMARIQTAIWLTPRLVPITLQGQVEGKATTKKRDVRKEAWNGFGVETFEH